jgi:hypothetical protein
MDSNDDVWAEGTATSSPSDLPQVMDLLSELFKRVQDEFAGYFLAGLLPTLGSFFAAFLGIGLVYGGMFLGMLPGIQSNDEELMMAGMFGSFVVTIPVMVIGMTAVFAPVQASLYRAVWRNLTEDEPLTVGSAFSTVTQDLGKVLLYNVVMMSLILVGSLMCYVPALLVMMGLGFAAPGVYIHRLGVGDAIRMSVTHVQEHLSWHVGFFGIGFAMLLVLQYIPILGTALLMTAYPLYVLMAYRHVYGEGDLPRTLMV